MDKEKKDSIRYNKIRLTAVVFEKFSYEINIVYNCQADCDRKKY